MNGLATPGVMPPFGLGLGTPALASAYGGALPSLNAFALASNGALGTPNPANVRGLSNVLLVSNLNDEVNRSNVESITMHPVSIYHYLCHSLAPPLSCLFLSYPHITLVFPLPSIPPCPLFLCISNSLSQCIRQTFLLGVFDGLLPTLKDARHYLYLNTPDSSQLS